MTRKSGGTVLALALAVGLVSAPLQAQRGPGFRGQGGGPHAGRSLDVLIENQEDLQLTKDQMSRIQELKLLMEADVLPLAEEIKTLRDQIRAGEVDREDGYRQLQSLQGEFMTASAPLSGRVEEILTVDQHRKLQGIVWQDRPGQGRGRAMRGPDASRGGKAFQGGMGTGAPRGQMRGSRGGFGPRQGYDGQGRGPAFGFRGSEGPGPFMGREDAVRGSRRGMGWVPPTEPGGLFSVL